MLLLTAMAAAMIAAMLAMLLLLIATTAIVATTAATRVGGWSAGRLERSHHEGCLERCLERSPQVVLRLSLLCVRMLVYVRSGCQPAVRAHAPCVSARICTSAFLCAYVRLRASPCIDDCDGN